MATSPRTIDGDVGLALLGTGAVATRSFLPAIRRTAGARLTAVLSRDPGRGKAFAAEAGAPAVYTSIAEVVANPDVHAVIVATPDAVHEEQVIAAAEAGVHVLCEKPMATTLAGAQRMADAVRRSGVTFAMGFTWRFLGGLRTAREVIHGGRLGTVRFVRALCTSLTPASAEVWRIDPARASSWAMSRAGTHGLDLYRWYFGEPTDVKAAVVSPRDGGNDELSAVMLTFPGGIVAEFVVSVLFPANSLEVYGDKGVLVGQNPFRHPPEAGAFRLNGEPLSYEPADAFAAEVADFVHAVRTGQPPTTGLDDGLRNMEMLERVLRR